MLIGLRRCVDYHLIPSLAKTLLFTRWVSFFLKPPSSGTGPSEYPDEVNLLASPQDLPTDF
jgi:hypothetical protein